MAEANTATLNWVKKFGQNQPQAITGVQGARVRVYARSQWTTQPPKRFTVWTKSFWARLGRLLHATGPTDRITVPDGQNGDIWLSEAWIAAPKDFPGEAEYYFEDSDGNRSGTMVVTTTRVGVTLKGVKVDGTVASAGPEGIEIKIPIKAGRETQATHELGAVVDPRVRVQLLYPWAGEWDEHDLTRAMLEWVESEGLTEALLSSAASSGPAGSVPPRLIVQALLEGFLSEENPGWEISLASGEPSPNIEDWRERQFAVGPDETQEIVVEIVAPPDGGRTSYALRVIDSDGAAVTSAIVELECDGETLCLTEGSPRSSA